MAAAFVQTATKGEASSATTLSTSAFGANPTAGNCLVVVGWGTGSVTSGQLTCSDTGGNTYTQAKFVTNATGGTPWAAIFYTLNLTSHATFKCTLTTSGGAIGVAVGASEFSGVSNSGQPDVAAVSNTNFGTAATPSSFSPPSDGDLLVTAFGDDTGASATINAPTSYSLIASENSGASFDQGGGAYFVQSSHAAINPSWTTSSSNWSCCQAALKAAVSFLAARPSVAGQAVKRAGYY